MTVEIIVATRNKHKFFEIKEKVQIENVKLISLENFPDAPVVIEDGNTFEENASKKALEISKATGQYVIADDSGLEVDALGGAPGVRSARFAGEDATDDQNSHLLLEQLAAVPLKERSARFRCVIVLLRQSTDPVISEGTCEGHIGFHSAGVNGFGYDPVFIPAEHYCTFAELTNAEKDAISHRGNALRKLSRSVAQIFT